MHSGSWLDDQDDGWTIFGYMLQRKKELIETPYAGTSNYSLPQGSLCHHPIASALIEVCGQMSSVPYAAGSMQCTGGWLSCGDDTDGPL